MYLAGLRRIYMTCSRISALALRPSWPPGHAERDERHAMNFARANPQRLHHLLAAHFYNMLALAAGVANAPRFKISFSLLVEPGTLLLKAATEIIGLSGAIHSVVSRANNGRFAIFFDTIVDYLATPPLATQPMAVANAILRSGLPPAFSVYPSTIGEVYSHLMLRLHYLSGTFAQRRAAFILYCPLLCQSSPVLGSFLLPASSDDQCVEAYVLMVTRIYVSLQPPADSALFYIDTAATLQDQLMLLPEIPQRATAMVPVGDAAVAYVCIHTHACYISRVTGCIVSPDPEAEAPLAF